MLFLAKIIHNPRAMLEILVLIFLCKNNASLVKKRGGTPWVYVLLTILLWVGFELIGALIGSLIFGDELIVYLFALAGGICGAIISYMLAKNVKPSKAENKDILDAEI